MLQSLSIRDFVIVETLDLEFSQGFTTLTGETGAGKSILIDALSLALGERNDGAVIRAGAERADISATFSNNEHASIWLENAALEVAPVLVLRRVIYSDGRSRGFINGTSVTIGQLKDLGELLVDIYSQNAHHSLLKTSTQRQILDEFAGSMALANQVATLYKSWHQLHLQRLEVEKNSAAYADELAELRDKTRELQQLGFATDEWAELQAEHHRLANGASLLSGLQACIALLDENEPAAMSTLAQVQQKLVSLVEFDEKLKEAADGVDSALIQLEEASRSLNRYLQAAELDPARLAEVESSIQAVHNTARKYRTKPEELPKMLAADLVRMAELESFANDGALMKLEAEALAAYQTSAKQLSANRQQAAKTLSQRISAEMQRLSLSGGKFDVALQLCEASANGLEQVEFLVAGHAGVEPRPLNKVASGGELSRISLALHVTTASQNSVPCMIFDEVDVGIGGGVAEVVGQLLKQLGTERQVLVITHLPQVAAQAAQHLQVSKTQVNGATLSHIQVLNKTERVEEIARMLGGIQITETTRNHAKEMLGV
ncbi:MAG TPA: DNA repair protein RecN [Methylotenera sp.]|nr:DNA repair protein RecN [Methylotenera sp.]HPV45075.1 DNA repair protein RecN [Methylotenera sp.]